MTGSRQATTRTAELRDATRTASPFKSTERPDPFQLLVAEHVLFRRDLERARLAMDGRHSLRDSAGHLGPLIARLRVHTEREDDVLAPVCERLFGGKQGAVAVMKEDHTRIKEALRSLGRAQGLQDRRERIERLRVRMESHFAREEHVLFPLMAAFLSNREAAALARRLRSRGPPEPGG